jgi:hypothetical protein
MNKGCWTIPFGDPSVVYQLAPAEAQHLKGSVALCRYSNSYAVDVSGCDMGTGIVVSEVGR